MEIKTCEEYVISELLTEKRKNEQLEELLAQFTKENNQLKDRIESFMSYFEVLAPLMSKDDGMIKVTSHWSWSNDSDYEILSELFGFLEDNFLKDEAEEGEDDN